MQADVIFEMPKAYIIHFDSKDIITSSADSRGDNIGGIYGLGYED